MQTEMLIGSRFVKGTEDEEKILDPRTGKTILSLPEASAGQIDEAVAAADNAFAKWSRTTPMERAGLLLKLAERIEAEADDFADPGSAQLRQAAAHRAPRRDAGGGRRVPLLRRRLPGHAGPRRPANICRATPRWSAATRSASSPRSRRGTTR